MTTRLKSKFYEWNFRIITAILKLLIYTHLQKKEKKTNWKLVCVKSRGLFVTSYNQDALDFQLAVVDNPLYCFTAHHNTTTNKFVVCNTKYPFLSPLSSLSLFKATFAVVKFSFPLFLLHRDTYIHTSLHCTTFASLYPNSLMSFFFFFAELN